jgi:hypothetical protein
VRLPRVRDRQAARRAAWVAAAALLALASGPASAEKPVELALKVEAGKTFRYKLDNQTIVNYQGTEMTSMSSGSLTMTRGADAVNKNLTFDIVVEKLEVSRRQGSQLQAQELGMDGAKLKAEVTSFGKVVNVEGVTTLSQQQLQIASNLVDVMFVDLPEKPVKTGETWKADLRKRDGSSTGSGEFTLDEIAKKNGLQVAKISGPVTVEAPAQSLTGKGTFEAAVAVDGGYTITAKGSMDLKGDGPTVEQTFELKLVE